MSLISTTVLATGVFNTFAATASNTSASDFLKDLNAALGPDAPTTAGTTTTTTPQPIVTKPTTPPAKKPASTLVVTPTTPPVTPTETPILVKPTTTSAATSAVSTASKSSEPVPVLNSAGQCTLGKIKNIAIETKKDRTILRWPALRGASGYDIARKNASGEYVVIERVTANMYTIHLAAETAYDDFQITAICSANNAPSMNVKEVTHVRTGPGEIALLLIASLIAGGFMVKRRRNA